MPLPPNNYCILSIPFPKLTKPPNQMSITSPINVLVVDNHQMFVDGVMAILNEEQDIKVIKGVYNPHDALEVLAQTTIDIVLTDIEMPEMSGIELTQIIKEKYPNTAVIVVSMYNQTLLIQKALEVGASGYILKETGRRELLQAVRSVYNGKTFYSSAVTDTIMNGFAAQTQKKKSHYALDYLTKREQDIISLILQENTNSEIAKALYISEHTVKTHRKRIMQKLEVKNVVGLVVLALKHT